MRIGETGHLSYCTNIHSGESWKDTFKNLQTYLLSIKDQIAKNNSFGIGLRLSWQAVSELSNKRVLDSFKAWLDSNNVYVFTINGFPYGNFHGKVIKDQVHTPDWTSVERKEYTILLFDVLCQLLPKDITGGVSTSPISYRYWFTTNSALEKAKLKSCEYLIDVVDHLISIKEQTNKSLHLDIEPEPDGVIENSDEFLEFYTNYLVEKGGIILMDKRNCTKEEATDYIKEHIQLCFDVCHFSVAYEKPTEVIQKMKEHDIKIGKVQLSAALKYHRLEEDRISDLKKILTPFHEPSYLHQTVVHTHNNDYLKFKDLNDAIKEIEQINLKEVRTHYHVPVFLATYENLQSTQDDLIETLALWNKEAFTNHLEVETYTWEVLPNQMQVALVTAIVRELNWVFKELRASEKTVNNKLTYHDNN